jgi:hypothetical protein
MTLLQAFLLGALLAFATSLVLIVLLIVTAPTEDRL